MSIRGGGGGNNLEFFIISKLGIVNNSFLIKTIRLGISSVTDSGLDSSDPVSNHKNGSGSDHENKKKTVSGFAS